MCQWVFYPNYKNTQFLIYTSILVAIHWTVECNISDGPALLKGSSNFYFYFFWKGRKKVVSAFWYLQQVKVCFWREGQGISDLYFGMFDMPATWNNMFCQHKHKHEQNAINPSKSKYLHTIMAESWNTEIPGGKHHKEYWGPPVLFIRHPSFPFFL